MCALRAKLAKSPPQPADYAAQPYPGAKFDPECSAEATAPRQPDGAGYCFYTLDPVDKVQAFVKGAGKPRNGGVSVSVREDVVSVDGIVKIDKVTMNHVLNPTVLYGVLRQLPRQSAASG